MLAQLVADVQNDFVDDDGEFLLTSVYVRRNAERALPLVALDVGVDYKLSSDADPVVVPEMTGTHRELWVLRTKMLSCPQLRSQANVRMSFTSGDKSMDRSKEAGNWATLCDDLAEQYRALLGRVNPSMDESVLNVQFAGATYRQRSYRRRNCN